MKKYNIGVSLLLIGISAGMLVTARGYNTTVKGTAMGAGEWPSILCVAMILLCGILLVQTFMDKSSDDEKPFEFKSEGMKRVYIMVAALTIFAVLLKTLGFYVAVAFLAPAMMYLLGERRVKIMVVLTVGILVFVYAVFSMFLGIKLPMGMLG